MTDLTPTGREMLTLLVEREQRGELPISGLPIPSEDWPSMSAALKLEKDGLSTIKGLPRFRFLNITPAGRDALKTVEARK